MLTATPPNVAKDGRYTITATAQALGVHRSTVNRWIAAQIIKPHFPKAGGIRAMITGEQIIKVWNLLS